MPTLTAATLSVSGSLAASAFRRRCRASTRAISAPVTLSVRVPPSASSTSQSSVMVPFAEGGEIDHGAKTAAHQALDFRGAAVDLAAAIAVFPRAGAAGNMPYSAVSQPRPRPAIQGGTFRDTLAVQSTVVRPGLDQDACRAAAGEMPLDLQRAKLVGLAVVVTHSGASKFCWRRQPSPPASRPGCLSERACGFRPAAMTTLCGPSITSSVTSSPRCAGRQCMKNAPFWRGPSRRR